MARTVKTVKADPNVASRRRRVGVIGLLIFLVIDIALVAWASAAANTPRSDTGAPGGGAQPAAAATVRPTPTASTAPKPATASPAPTTAAEAVSPSRLLAAVDGDTAWRAATGPCPATPAAIELTTDGGATWKKSDASGPAKASALVRLTAQSAKQASAVALAADGCSPEFIRTYVGGDNWAAYAGEATSAWYLDPRATGTVHSPNGDVSAPCPAVGLAVGAPTQAALLCANHDVYRTSDSGATWGSPKQVSGAVAIGARDGGYVVAAVGSGSCGGVQVVSLDAGTGEAAALACVGSTPPPAGGVAISGGTGAVWLWAGDAVARSTDGGTTWR